MGTIAVTLDISGIGPGAAGEVCYELYTLEQDARGNAVAAAFRGDGAIVSQRAQMAELLLRVRKILEAVETRQWAPLATVPRP